MVGREVYLDNAATTKVDEEVAESMQEFLDENYGNPSSPHTKGFEARTALENARKTIAQELGANRSDIVFTSGGTESNNLAIKGAAYINEERGNHIITTEIEHLSVLNMCRQLEKEGFDVTYLEVDESGFVGPEDVKEAIKDDTILVSVMTANNEIGTIQPVEEIGKICGEEGVYFHTDAVQAFKKADVKAKYADLISISAHKIHGPKGVGALYVGEDADIEKLQNGGPHEQDLRAGTQNVPAIVGFAKAVDNMNEKDVLRMARLRDELADALLEMEGTTLFGGREERLCNNINIGFEGVDAQDLLKHLDHKGIYVSAGSACESQTLEPSHVLKAIGLSDEEAQSSIRMTLDKYTSEEDVKYVAETVRAIVTSLRKIRMRVTG